jgi:hypothetical protein
MLDEVGQPVDLPPAFDATAQERDAMTFDACLPPQGLTIARR